MLIFQWLLIVLTTSRCLARLELIPQWVDGSGILVLSYFGRKGTVCLDRFTLSDANVACRELNQGWARYIRYFRVQDIHELNPIFRRPIIRINRCRGDERSLLHCQSMINLSRKGVRCSRSDLGVGVRCTRASPDLLVDKVSLENSAYLQRVPLYQLECSLEENCLSINSEEAMLPNSSISTHSNHRDLLRFSTILTNIGDSEFLPHQESASWSWHACHKHFHSMLEFAHYEVREKSGKHEILALGHKASFCLEDNVCQDGIQSRFNCTSGPGKPRGSQGITPGCSDTYLHDIDCQWVDMTGLSPDKDYMFRLSVNTDYQVAEKNYTNNVVICNLNYRGDRASFDSCRYSHPLDLE